MNLHRLAETVQSPGGEAASFLCVSAAPRETILSSEPGDLMPVVEIDRAKASSGMEQRRLQDDVYLHNRLKRRYHTSVGGMK
jgi:hypothetical protein